MHFKNQVCLKIKNLSIFNKQMGKYILKNLNIKMNNQQVIYLVGPNGIGKSLFLKTIAGVIKDLDEQNIFDISGNIYFNNKDITSISTSQRSKMGIFYAWQNPPAIPELTVSNYFSALGVTQNIIEDLLKKVGLPNNILKKPLNLDMSGGQIKRLEVISLLILKPKLLLLDELDSGLDIKSEKFLFKILYDYIAEHNSCAIVVSHNLRIVEYFPPQFVYEFSSQKIHGPYKKEWLNTYLKGN